MMEELYKHLAHSCVEYIALTPLSKPQAHVLFAGEFDHKPILWDCTLLVYKAKQFIDILSIEKGTATLEIGLNVSSISEPTVLKSIMMIRQFKNLKPGRHEFAGLYK